MYICIAPEKEVFNVYGKSLGVEPKRALYYSTDVGRHRIYRNSYPLDSFYFNGVDINKKLKPLKYKSLEYARKICGEINKAYGDNFKPVLEEQEQ